MNIKKTVTLLLFAIASMTYLTAYAENSSDRFKPGWHEYKTIKGCIYYVQDERYDPTWDERYPESLWDHDWSGKCEAGKPISCKRKLTGTPRDVKDDRHSEEIGTYVNGRKEGFFEDKDSTSDDDEAIYKGGCRIKSGFDDLEMSKTFVPVLAAKKFKKN